MLLIPNCYKELEEKDFNISLNVFRNQRSFYSYITIYYHMKVYHHVIVQCFSMLDVNNTIHTHIYLSYYTYKRFHRNFAGYPHCPPRPPTFDSSLKKFSFNFQFEYHSFTPFLSSYRACILIILFVSSQFENFLHF